MGSVTRVGPGQIRGSRRIIEGGRSIERSGLRRGTHEPLTHGARRRSRHRRRRHGGRRRCGRRAAPPTGPRAPRATSTCRPSRSSRATRPPRAAPSGSPAGPGRRGPGGMAGLGLLGGGILHGDVVVQGKDGKPVEVVVQRGTVTSVSDGTLVVHSSDGFDQTWTTGKDTRYAARRRVRPRPMAARPPRRLGRSVRRSHPVRAAVGVQRREGRDGPRPRTSKRQQAHRDPRPVRPGAHGWSRRRPLPARWRASLADGSGAAWDTASTSTARTRRPSRAASASKA